MVVSEMMAGAGSSVIVTVRLCRPWGWCEESMTVDHSHL